jgi:Xaa-Pro aminopeptidase
VSIRLDQVRAKMVENKLDILIVSQRENQRYLSGFAGGADFDSILLIAANDASVATDSRYWDMAEEAARRAAPPRDGFKLVKLKRDDYDLNDAIRDFAAAQNAQTIGFEPKHVTYTRFRAWQKAGRKAHAKLQPTENLVEQLRAIKDGAELAAIRRAVALTDTAFAHFCKNARIGMTEKQGAWLIESFMREHNGDRIAFDLIVASGPNTALPHADPTDRGFQSGEPITIDIGARIDGYNSDMTRTFCFSEASDKFKEVYGIVLKAQEAVEKGTRAGLRGKQVDALARRIIEKAGYGENFGHSLGHGVGLQVHELPRAGRKSKDILEPDMTLTVEPGIYVPGWGGVRLEDLVVIQQNGVEVLTRAKKDPIVGLDGA